MDTVETLTTFLGWCTAVNFGIILLSIAFFTLFHDPFGQLTARIFGVSSAAAKGSFAHAFQLYRVLFVLLNVVPYLALNLM